MKAVVSISSSTISRFSTFSFHYSSLGCAAWNSLSLRDGGPVIQGAGGAGPLVAGDADGPPGRANVGDLTFQCSKRIDRTLFPKPADSLGQTLCSTNEPFLRTSPFAVG